MTTTTIAHTTDLSGDDSAAFHHAAALAAASGARLITVHGNPGEVTAAQLPDAAPLAARWGRVIAHQRICHECCDEVADTVIDAIHQLRPQLVVAGTHARHESGLRLQWQELRLRARFAREIRRLQRRQRSLRRRTGILPAIAEGRRRRAREDR